MPSQSPKSESLRVRLTEEEAAAFKAYAESRGETRTTLLRQYIRESVNHPWPDLLESEQSSLRVVVRYLAGISRNLNQITTAINSGKTMTRLNESYLGEIKRHVDDVKREFTNYLVATRERSIKPAQEGNDNAQ